MADITVYSTSWCGFCRMAKAYFQSKNVPFDDIDVEQDREAAQYIVNETRQMGVPVIKIGDQFIIGFNRPQIDAALQNLKPS